MFVPILGILMFVPILLWVERRGAGLIQDRPGPNRVGPFGLMQPLADVIKFFFKEDLIPGTVDRGLYLLAPALAVFSALTTFAVIPYGATLPLKNGDVPLIGADVSIGILYVFAITSLSVY
ncbi:MAG TPA: complex I subunit 1 family protein, partial [Thermoanaerobaculia bacterium]